MKNTGLWIRTAIIIAITVVGIYLVFGPRHTVSANDFTWQGIKDNLGHNINLGLDLKGGSHLLMRVKTEEYLKTLTENNEQAAVQAGKEAKDESGQPLPVTDGSFVADNGVYQFSVNLTDPSKSQAVIDAIKKKVDLVNWTQSTSGNSIVWSLPVQMQSRMKEQATDQAFKIIDSRINAFGVKEPTLQRQGRSDSGQILLQMPGVENPERVKELVGKASQLVLMKVVGPSSPSPVQTFPTQEAALASIGGKDNATRRVLPYSERDKGTNTATTSPTPSDKPKQFVVVELPPVVDGTELRDASAAPARAGGQEYDVNFQFKPGGAQKFGDWTGKNINNYMAVVLDSEVKSIAYIKSQIFDQGQITGRFTKKLGRRPRPHP